MGERALRRLVVAMIVLVAAGCVACVAVLGTTSGPGGGEPGRTVPPPVDEVPGR